MTKKLDHTYLSGSIGLINPKEAILLSEKCPIQDAINALNSCTGGAILLIDETDHLSGIFTERDVIRKVLPANIPFDTEVSEVMTRNPTTIDMTTPIGFALQLMTQGGFRNLPITDDTKTPIGVVSIKDIMDEFVRSFVLGK
jgi:signal-transduction protein with cAMP-binding, CBS, and nucleotidyltransferase domain